MKERQFSIRILLGVVTIAAVVSLIAAARYRKFANEMRIAQFVAAIEDSDLEEVDRLLTADPTLAHGRVHGETTWPETALQKAIQSPELFDRILQESPDLEATSERGVTVLAMVGERGRSVGADAVFPMIERLVELGADVNGGDKLGVDPSTPLQGCIYGTTVGFVPRAIELLLESGADINADYRDDQNTSLHLAVNNGNEEVIALLLKCGADVNAVNADGETPLHGAMLSNWMRISRTLVASGADLTVKNRKGVMPGEWMKNNVLFYEAIVRAHDEDRVAEADGMLRETRHILDWPRKQPMLLRAAEDDRLDVLKYLLSRGADPALVYDVNARRTELTVLHAMSGSQKTSKGGGDVAAMVGAIVEAGANIEARDGSARTPLHFAASHHNHVMLNALIEHGADVSALDAQKTTVMESAFLDLFRPGTGVQTLKILKRAGHPTGALFAAATGDVPSLEKLKEKNASFVNQTHTAKKITPLLAAVAANEVGTTKWLLKHGADPQVEIPLHWNMGHSLSLLDISLSSAFIDVAVALIEGGADANGLSDRWGTPLHMVLQWGVEPPVFEALLKNGADVAARHEGMSVRERAIKQLAINGGHGRFQRYIDLLDEHAEKK